MADLRAEMPETAAFIDALREVFGVDAVNAQIRAGLKGGGEFHAIEGGREIGSPCRLSQGGRAVTLRDVVIYAEPVKGLREGRP